MAFFSNIFLDRDGTLIEDKHYLSDPAGVELLPGVGAALAQLNSAGSRLFMVSNQSGIGRGMFPYEAAVACNVETTKQINAFGACFTDMEFCPHLPEEECSCRKPRTGMWKTLQARHSLEASSTLMIGDKTADLCFAARAGLAARALVMTGKGAKTAAALGLSLGPTWEQTGYALYLDETRPEYPQILIKDFTVLVAALEAFRARV